MIVFKKSLLLKYNVRIEGGFLKKQRASLTNGFKNSFQNFMLKILYAMSVFFRLWVNLRGKKYVFVESSEK